MAAKKTSSTSTAPAKKTPAAKKPATKPATKKQAASTKPAPKKPRQATAAKSAEKATSAEQPAKKPAATKKSVGTKETAGTKKAGGADGKGWTKAELASIRTELTEEIERLRAELAQAEEHLNQLREGQSAASGEDPVDTGAHAYERESELAIVAHAEGTIRQCEEALHRLDDGTFGTCERCGQPIAKLRLQAFPKATSCIECKKLQERR